MTNYMQDCLVFDPNLILDCLFTLAHKQMV